MGDLVAALKDIPVLDMYGALENLSGDEDLYEQILQKVINRLLSHLEAMAQALTARETKSFGMQAHGLKGAFSQIGATALAAQAETLENAAKRGDRPYCEARYGDFKAEALSLCTQVNRLLRDNGIPVDGADAPAVAAGQLCDHMAALTQAKEAAAGFDSVVASGALSPLTRYRFGPQPDALILQALGELEAFHPRKAVPYITALLDACAHQADARD